MLEFREVLPASRGQSFPQSSRHVSAAIQRYATSDNFRITRGSPLACPFFVVPIARFFAGTYFFRYLFQDAWNILDVSTILFAGGAFTLRMVNLRGQDGDDEGGNGSPISLVTAEFLAQVLLAVSALPLFARILSLSQIDNTLGPMTQIIWKMLSHLAKFSVFVAVLIASFALACHAIFHKCEEGHTLDEEYGTFSEAYLTMFRALLGDFNFESFKSARTCDIPRWAEPLGVFLLVLYLAISSVLLLNLLIAVLSTAHAEVSGAGMLKAALVKTHV